MYRWLLALAWTLVGCSGSVVPIQDRASVTPDLVFDGPSGMVDRGTVVRVVDGDTIRVDIGGTEERVRYIGVDTPESVDPRKTIQPYAVEAGEANRRLVDGRSIVLERDVSDRDRYGRLLRYVWLEREDGWILVNYELVRRGFASAVSYPPDVKYQSLLREAAATAREQRLGLWSER